MFSVDWIEIILYRHGPLRLYAADSAESPSRTMVQILVSGNYTQISSFFHLCLGMRVSWGGSRVGKGKVS